MKIKCILSAALAGILLITGCSGDNSGVSPTDSSADEPKTVVPITDTYTPSSYTPSSGSTTIMSEQIPGAFGESTDSGLPAVFISTDDPEAITRDEYVSCTMQIDAGMTDGRYESTEVLTGGIRGRGHSTWEWAKRPYKIKLDDKKSLLGMTEAKRWVLLANYADESLLRNTVSFEVARTFDSFRFVPHAIPVNVYMNGIYQGVYTMCEQLEVKSSRLAIDDSLANVETGYLLEIGGADPNTDQKGWNYFDLPSGCGINIKIKSPDTETDPNSDYNWTQEHFDFIYNYVCRADKAITTLTNYDKFIDIDSFVDWFLVHEFSYNLDSCFNRSCYITKPKLGRLEMGPVWDFDLAFGNMYRDNPKYNDWATVGSEESGSYIGITWYNYLMTDDDFRAKVRARWDEVKDTMLTTALDTINYYKPLIATSADKNFKVWRTLAIPNGFQPEAMKDVTSFTEQLQYFTKFLYSRKKWIDENL